MSKPGAIRTFEFTFDSGSSIRVSIIKDNENAYHIINEGYNPKGEMTSDITRTYGSLEAAEWKFNEVTARYRDPACNITETEMPVDEWYFPEDVVEALHRDEAKTPGQRIDKKKPQQQTQEKQTAKLPKNPVVVEDRTTAQSPQVTTDKSSGTKTETVKPETGQLTPPDRTRMTGAQNQIQGSGGIEGVLQSAERGIGEFFGQGRAANIKLKGRLEDYVLGGGSPILGALGASALDVLDLAMGVAEGIPMGVLDTRRIGEGLAKGTWAGAKEDLQRALNVIPQGRVLRALDTALGITDVGTQMAAGNYKGAAMAAGMMAAAARKKGGSAKTPEDGFARECADQFKSDFKKVETKHRRKNGKSNKMQVSVEAHKKTQSEIKKRYGDDVETELPLGVTHFGRQPGKVRWNMGALDDITNIPMNIRVELKSYVHFKDGHVSVNKKIGGQWKSAMTDQIASLEIYARSTGGKAYIATASGKVYSYNPATYRWVEVKQ